jgi:hypothetical protein
MDVNPFNIREIRISLFLAMDIDRLVFVYPSNKELLDDPIFLSNLCKIHNINQKGTVYKNGAKSETLLVENFANFIFYVYLKSNEKYKLLCISDVGFLRAAIRINDVQLFKKLCLEISSGDLPDYIDENEEFSEIVSYEAGKYNNSEIIKYILSNTDSKKDEMKYILGGYAEGHHNNEIDKYLSSKHLGFDPNSDLHIMCHGLINGNNFELLKKYWNFIPNHRELLDLKEIAKVDSSEILNIILTNNGKTSSRSLSNDENELLFYGYIQGGNLEKATNVYKKLKKKKSKIFNNTALYSALIGDNIECYKLVEKLIKPKYNDIIDLMHLIEHLSETLL